MPFLLDDHIGHDPEGVALVDGAGRRTWRELGQRVDRWIGLLADAGLARGDRVAAVLGNGSGTFEVVLACLHSGLTLVPVNWHLTAPEIAYVVADSGARAIVVDPAHAATAARALHETATAPCALRLVLGEGDGHGFDAVEPRLRAAPAARPDEQVCGSMMLYTSGTTGAPKGVDNGLFRLGAPFERVGRTARYARDVLGVPEREVVLLDGPWYHSSQLFFSLLPLLLGSRLIIRPSFDPAETLRVIERERVTTAHFVPTQLLRLLRLDEATRHGFSPDGLRRVWHGSGPCGVDVKRRMIAWWGPVLVEYYGATEAGAVTLIDSEDWLSRPGSVGRPLPGTDVVVVDDEGHPVPAGTIGRVYVRRAGRGFSYHNAPEKTRSAQLEPGTFTFGEIGRLDRDGFLYLEGRSKELIVTGGVNVYPAEVESVLCDHPAVADAAVVGTADEEFGERVVGLVQRSVAAPPDPAEVVRLLDAHCRRSLAGFKVPRTYRWVDELPREATGKLRRDALTPLLGGPAALQDAA